MHIRVISREELTDTELEQLRDVRASEEPPDATDFDFVSRYTWASSQYRILASPEAGGEIVAHAGVVLRDGLLDDWPVRIGGVGGVKSHAAVRGKRFGQAVLQRAADLMVDEFGVDFGFLVCPEYVIGFYEKLGWSQFTGTILVDQPDGKVVFSGNQPMTLSGRQAAPRSGTIDLQGLPW